MNSSIVVLAGIAIFFNFAIILYKTRAARYLDAFIDATTFVAISYITSGSATGFVAGMIGSALLSVFLLLINPFKNIFDDDDYEYDERPRYEPRTHA